MSGRFVRASKYRHVFGQSTKREQCYDNLRISKNAWDTNLVKANPKYLAVNWEAGGGGAFAVIPLEERGKVPDLIPLFRGHTAVVLDTDWSPFDDSILASASDDGKVFLWQVPEDFTLRTDADEPEDVKPVGKLSGHSRKVGHVLFNPAAENVLASSSGDYTVKIWDLENGKPKLTLQGNDIFTSLSWSANGSMLVTTSRDKKLRFWDVRQQTPAHEVPNHSGAKSSRVVWMGDHDRVTTTGFSKMSERQLALWDIRSPQLPIGDFTTLDSGSGVLMPFWDDGSQILYLAGKGDGNIRYYEYQNDKFESLSEYRSVSPQRGLAFVPKRGVDTHGNEVARAFKTIDDSYIEPISFIVPRRAETFQEDIYPPAVGTTPAMSSSEWFGGKTALPPKLLMGDLYDGNAAPKLVAAEDVPKAAPPTTAAPALTKPTPAPAPTPAPVQAPASASSNHNIADNKNAMINVASKYADDDAAPHDEDEDDDFEEIQKPVERPSVAAARASPPTHSQPPSRSTTLPQETHTPSIPASRDLPAPQPAAEQPSSSSTAPAPTSTPPPSSSSSTAAAGGPAAGLRDALTEIRELLRSQGKQIQTLTEEVQGLKSRLDA